MNDSSANDEVKQADVIPYVVPSHTIDKNDCAGIAKAIRKWRPASRCRLLTASRVRVMLEIRESDAASANISYIHHMVVKAREFAEPGQRIILVHQLCLLHQAHLIVGLLVKLLGGPTVTLPSLLFCVSKVLRTPGHWEALLATVPRTVALCLVIKNTGWTEDCRTPTVSSLTVLFSKSIPSGYTTSIDPRSLGVSEITVAGISGSIPQHL